MDLKRILIINPYGIGDVLFTTPVIANLRLCFPKADIGYLCNGRTAQFLKFNPEVAKVFVYERDEFVAIWRKDPFKYVQKWADFFAAVKQQSFEAVFDFSLNSTFGFLAAVCGLRRG
jgi:ADP-heptose:LPS heptosyltransferase